MRGFVLKKRISKSEKVRDGGYQRENEGVENDREEDLNGEF